tara:strand:+ start:476 stop:787 length:312 start_codon:yes stop_codon:yes gene_type:complete
MITIGSSIPGANISKLDLFSSDKVLHILEYFLLGYLLINVLIDKTNYPSLLTFFLGFLFGVIDEIYQSTVIGRFPSSFDVIADVIGLTLSIILFQKFSDIMNR